MAQLKDTYFKGNLTISGGGHVSGAFPILSGTLSVGSSTVSGVGTFVPTGVAQVAIAVKGYTGQTANLIAVYDSTSNPLLLVGSNGFITGTSGKFSGSISAANAISAASGIFNTISGANVKISGSSGNLLEVWGSNAISAFHIDTSGYSYYDKYLWDDSFSPPVAFNLGPSAPSLSALTGGIVVPAFQPAAQDDTGYFTIQLPHSISPSSNIDFHIHVTTQSVPSADAADVSAVFRLIYTYANMSGTLFAPVTADKVLVLTSAMSAYQHHILSWDEISGMQAAGQHTNISTIMMGTLQRLASTCASEDTYNEGVYLIGADCHFQKNTVGSRQEYSK